MSHTESIFTQEKYERFKFPPDSLQLQGGSGSLFCSNWKETDVTFSQLSWKQLIYSKWYWAGSTASKLNLASAITLFPFICAWGINLRLLCAFFNYRTSHKSPYKTAHKVECEEGGIICQKLKGRTCQEWGYSLFPPSDSLKMNQNEYQFLEIKWFVDTTFYFKASNERS